MVQNTLGSNLSVIKVMLKRFILLSYSQQNISKQPLRLSSSVGKALSCDHKALSSNLIFAYVKNIYCIISYKVPQTPACIVKATVVQVVKHTFITIMAALESWVQIPTQRQSSTALRPLPDSLFEVHMQWIVKYEFLHVFGQEICGSQVWALPHGFRGCWFDPSQISAIWMVWCEWRVRPKEGDTSTVSSRSFRHNVQQRLCFWPDGKNII